MTVDERLSLKRDLSSYLELAESVILPRGLSERAGPAPVDPDRKLRVGVDLGTAYLVLVVLDEDGAPLAGEWQYAEVVRDGLVVDYVGAVDRLRGMKARMEQRLGRPLTHAASGYPPGVPEVERQATAHVLAAAGLDCSGLIDEPSAANFVLQLEDGAIVDVGGGTTGIAILRNGQVIYTADEATGGLHFSLVIAGSLNVSLEEAERIKVDHSQQPRLLPLVRPVMEKVGSIINRHVQGKGIPSLTMVGGGSAFLRMGEIIQEWTEIPTQVVAWPLFVTPLGLALHDQPQ